MRPENVYELAQTLLNANPNTQDELVKPLAQTNGGRVELIVSTGQVSPPDFVYEQNEDEWVMVLQGEAVIEANGETHKMLAGNSLFLPKGLKHRVLYTSSRPPCLWLAVFWR